MEKETQQHEGHPSTRSLPRHRASSKSDTISGRKQDIDQKVERWLRLFDLLKPHIIWTVLVVIAICNLFYAMNIVNVVIFLVLLAVAAGYITLLQAIALLQGRSMHTSLLPPSEEKKARDQPGEQTTHEQDEAE